jgi:hypothetical protein
MSYLALIVPGMNDPHRFDIIVTIKREGGILPDPARFVMAARRAASNGAVDGNLMFAWAAEKVITSMAVAGVPDEPSALGVVSDALRDLGRNLPPERIVRRSRSSSSRGWTARPSWSTR